jgi:outer membrane protein insertion porin family
MSRLNYFFSFLFCCFFFLTGIVAQERDSVSKITIKGLMTNVEDSIKTKLETQVGQPFSAQSLRNDIQRLHQLALFANIEVQVEQTSEGVHIIFIVTENQLLGEIRFHGNDHMKENDLLKVMRLSQEKYLAPYLLSIDITELKEHYHKKGYPFVNIKADKKVTGNWVDLDLYIQEGPRVKVYEICFFGNKTFTKGDLLDLGQTKESGLFIAKYYNEETFQEDLILMRNFYRSEGFLDAQINLRDISYSADRTKLTLNISVDEGPRYYVDRIVFKGNKLFSIDELKARFVMKEESIFKQGDMLSDKNKIEHLYGENGFLNIKVTPNWKISDLNTYKVTLFYTIEEGDINYIRRIEIRGNTITQEHVIRRELTLSPGEQFHLGRLDESKARLQRLRYFETIKISFEETASPNWKDIVFQVEEGQTGNLRFAAGVTSDIGAIGEISLTKRNFDIAKWPTSLADFLSGESFTGAGQSFDIYFQAGKEYLRFKIGFQEPHLFGTDWSLSPEFYSLARGRESWEEHTLGGQIGIGHKVTENSNFKVSYRFDQVRVKHLDDDAPWDVVDVEGPSYVSALMLNYTIDTRDDYIQPTRGYIIGLSYELAGVFLGGDYDFSKFNIRLAWFTSVYTNDKGHKHVLSFGLKTGFADAICDSDSIPVFERYFAGGASTIRGFEYRTVSPKEQDRSRSHDPIGGNCMFLGTIEYSIPMYEDILRLVFFTDIGNVTPEVDSTIFDNIRVGIGVGLRIKIPMLGPRPFALDLAYPICKEDDDKKQIFSFSFGKQF